MLDTVLSNSSSRVQVLYNIGFTLIMKVNTETPFERTKIASPDDIVNSLVSAYSKQSLC